MDACPLLSDWLGVVVVTALLLATCYCSCRCLCDNSCEQTLILLLPLILHLLLAATANPPPSALPSAKLFLSSVWFVSLCLSVSLPLRPSVSVSLLHLSFSLPTRSTVEKRRLALWSLPHTPPHPPPSQSPKSSRNFLPLLLFLLLLLLLLLLLIHLLLSSLHSLDYPFLTHHLLPPPPLPFHTTHSSTWLPNYPFALSPTPLPPPHTSTLPLLTPTSCSNFSIARPRPSHSTFRPTITFYLATLPLTPHRRIHASSHNQRTTTTPPPPWVTLRSPPLSPLIEKPFLLLFLPLSVVTPLCSPSTLSPNPNPKKNTSQLCPRAHR
ncbi:hypothetical protein BZA05DRAFT_261329 [Tricharina praecox]|uniref:uncharacterized protein n=1 Tax=Tricharina praecox TaxID=43433 RepID=UPI002220A482|nr:uncharacterized protein BZA05DRAFT_261329 [Tricharina praecox]KAI5854254.1 hypothetical protein BZA05DRAFT_261329 [Tricharina praecox]